MYVYMYSCICVGRYACWDVCMYACRYICMKLPTRELGVRNQPVGSVTDLDCHLKKALESGQMLLRPDQGGPRWQESLDNLGPIKENLG
jgi:hypothetical protein